MPTSLGQNPPAGGGGFQSPSFGPGQAGPAGAPFSLDAFAPTQAAGSARAAKAPDLWAALAGNPYYLGPVGTDRWAPDFTAVMQQIVAQSNPRLSYALSSPTVDIPDVYGTGRRPFDPEQEPAPISTPGEPPIGETMQPSVSPSNAGPISETLTPAPDANPLYASPASAVIGPASNAQQTPAAPNISETPKLAQPIRARPLGPRQFLRPPQIGIPEGATPGVNQGAAPEQNYGPKLSAPLPSQTDSPKGWG